MSKPERVAEALNHALHALFADDPRVFLIGEDICDPYGGAFKVSKGLSTRYPDRVLATPISEQAIVGLAAGLALCGNTPIVEIMFGDFIALAFDQILNFVSKSVAMYGRTLDMRLVIRCPIGGQRGYGPTHSQCLQKHFIGIPHLSLFELSPLHDIDALLRYLINSDHPAILFEDKSTYAQRMFSDGVVSELFRYRFLDQQQHIAHVFSPSFDTCECTIITTGGMANRCIAAAQQIFIDYEVGTQIIVPAQLYPFCAEPLLKLLRTGKPIIIVEEGTAGGTWGSEVATHLYHHLWDSLRRPIQLVSSRLEVIPTSLHLEKQIIVQQEDIYRAIKEVCVNV